MTAKQRALQAIRKHGKLVQSRSYSNYWSIHGENGRIICGTVTINRLVEDGLVVTRWGTTHREAVFTDEGKR